MRFVSGIILILSKNELHSLSWWRHCKKNRKKVAFLGTIWPVMYIHMQIFSYFFSWILCIKYVISICDRGRSVFTFKSRWLSRIHVHFLSLVVEPWHTFSIDWIKKLIAINYLHFLPIWFTYFSTFTCRKESQIQTSERTFILIVLINTEISHHLYQK